MRVDARIPECGGHPFNHRVRHGVLQPLGLFVDRIPGVAEELDEVGLDQPVPPDHSQRRASTLVGQLDTTIRDVLQEAVLGQPLDHARH